MIQIYVSIAGIFSFSLEQKLCDASYNASCLPVLSFSFCNLGELRAALLKPEEHSGIIFTSQRAVEAATKAIKDSNDTTMKGSMTNYVIFFK